MKAAPQEQTPRKPVLKVAVGGPTYSRPELCYTYLIELPGVFQRIGNSENPGKLKEQLELDFGAPLILAQVRAFRDRGAATYYESKLHSKYAPHRIHPSPYAKAGSKNFYSPNVEIQL